MKKTIALIFMASTLFLADCCTTHEHATVQWAYQKVWDFKTVQKLSTEGWVLDGFHSFDASDNGTYYIMKHRVH